MLNQARIDRFIKAVFIVMTLCQAYINDKPITSCSPNGKMTPVLVSVVIGGLTTLPLGDRYRGGDVTERERFREVT